VLHDVSLTVREGEIVGLLGPNGAGKTTTTLAAVGLLPSESGEVRTLGRDPWQDGAKLRRRIGVLPDPHGFYDWMSARDYLAFFAGLYGATLDDASLKRRLDAVGLSPRPGQTIGTFSRGMRQRLGLARALVADPLLLVLDEPTNGLDPQGMREIRSLIKSLAADGTTVFLSSHLLDEIEQVCTHAAVMSRGRLVIQGTVDQLGAGQRARLAVTTPDASAAEKVLADVGGTDLHVEGERVHCDAEGLEPDAVCAALVAAGVRVFGFGIERPSLEDAFVALTGEGFDVAE
jgi:ABC-2 type transport system ATP-binding protein